MKRKIFFVLLILIIFFLTIFLKKNIFQNGKKVSKNESKKEKIIKKVEKEKRVSLSMVGDVLIHSLVYKDAKIGKNKYDFKPMLSLIKDKFQKYDLNFYNQETIIGGKKLGLSTYPVFNSPEEIGEDMIWAGANLVSLANNHSLDKGLRGIKNSSKFWNKQKEILAVGSYASKKEKENKNHIFEKNGIKFAFFAYTTLTNGFKPKYNWELDIFSKEKFLKDIQKVREKVDVILISIHWGVEYRKEPTKGQKELAKFMAQNGADIIIGNHPHVIEPIEKIGNTLVVYSLGNFLSSQRELNKRVGLFLGLDIVKKNKKIKFENISPKLIYVNHNKNRWKDFKVIPFSKLDNNILSDYKKIENKYLKIVGEIK